VIEYAIFLHMLAQQ